MANAYRWLFLAWEEAADFVPEVRDHPYCESERHQGGRRRATFVEMLEPEPEDGTPGMWSSCTACHERMGEIVGRVS